MVDDPRLEERKQFMKRKHLMLNLTNFSLIFWSFKKERRVFCQLEKEEKGRDHSEQKEKGLQWGDSLLWNYITWKNWERVTRIAE